MVTCKNSIENFKARMEDLIGSKYILADNKVSEVLKTISDSSLLYEIFEYVTENFDYETFKSVCFSVDDDNRGKLTLPKKDKDVLAFCFLLLMEIDSRKIDLLELCSACFFSQEGKQGDFDLFASSVLVPFKEITVKVAYRLINESLEEEIAQDLEEEFDENQDAKIDENENLTPTVIDKALITIIKIRDSISLKKAKDRKAGDEYDEIVFVLEQLEEYIKQKNPVGITLAFTALKYINKSVKKFKINLDKLASYIAEVL